MKDEVCTLISTEKDSSNNLSVIANAQSACQFVYTLPPHHHPVPRTADQLKANGRSELHQSRRFIQTEQEKLGQLHQEPGLESQVLSVTRLT